MSSKKLFEYIYGKDLYPIYEVQKISRKLNTIIEILCSLEDEIKIINFIYVLGIDKLSEKHIDKLTKVIAKTMNAPYVYYYTIMLSSRLTQEQIDMLTVSICNSNNAECIYKFARSVPNLNESNKKCLANAIFETEDVEYIKVFKDSISGLNENSKLFLEKRYKYLRFINSEEEELKKKLGSRKVYICGK